MFDRRRVLESGGCKGELYRRRGTPAAALPSVDSDLEGATRRPIDGRGWPSSSGLPFKCAAARTAARSARTRRGACQAEPHDSGSSLSDESHPPMEISGLWPLFPVKCRPDAANRPAEHGGLSVTCAPMSLPLGA